jgi:hypothetical protein
VKNSTGSYFPNQVWRVFLWACVIPLGFALGGCGKDGTWEKVGGSTASPSSASWESLACHKGALYLAFQDEAMGNRVSVLRFGDGVWSPIGITGFSHSGITSGISLAVDSVNDIPYVAYRISKIDLVKQPNGKPKPRVTNGLYAEKFNGKVWEDLGGPLSGDDIPAFFVGGGSPYLASTTAGTVEVKRFDGKSWRKCGDKALTSSGYPFTWGGVFVDPSTGEAYVAVRNEAKNWVFVAKDKGQSWEILGQSYIPGTNGADNGSLWVDQGRVYLAFRDAAHGGKATVEFFDGTKWTTVGAPVFSDGPVNAMSLMVHQGIPYLAYQDNGHNGKATVMRCDGGVWRSVGKKGFSEGAATFETLSMDEITHTLYLAYKDAANGGRAVVMRYRNEVP